MSFLVLALICAVALAGPVLAINRRLHLPVVMGELAVGVLLGRTGAQWIDPTNETFTFMAEIGFALVMFLAGANVPLRNPAMSQGLRVGALRAAAVGVLSVPVALGIAQLFGSDHGWLFAVILASSSAGLLMPALQGTSVQSRGGLEFLPQIAIADAACIVALPLVVDPARAGRAALGAVAVGLIAAVYFVFLRWGERSGRRRRVHEVSKRRLLALELRVVLIMLFALAGVAVATGVSVMLPGFLMGLIVAAVGLPNRVEAQTLALTQGLFAPIFFVWLGASLDLRQLRERPDALALGLALGLAALIVHGAMVLTRQPAPLALASAAQLGVPIGAAALGARTGALSPGEQTALLLSALVTIVAVALLSRGIRASVDHPAPKIAAQAG